jgi:peroxiredoxin
MWRPAAPLCLAFLLSGLCSAGQYNEVLSIGDKAPPWTDLPGVDDRTHSLSDLADHEVVVVVFTCNSCPYAVDYEDRLLALHERFIRSGKRAALVAINVNKIPEDALPAMKQRAAAKGFPFPYLYDESQKIARDYGATRTPEFFVLNQERRVVYMGAMDDNSDSSKVTKSYVPEAVEAALRGKPAEPAETPPVGCAIRFDRSLRRKGSS